MKNLANLCALALLLIAAAPPGKEKYVVTNAVCYDISVTGKLYLVDNKLNLEAHGLLTDSIRRFSVSNFGYEPMIDASNPLEVFVFFPAAGRIVVFDNQINVQQDLQIFKQEYIQPGAFGRSNDGNIWIFDNNSKTLKKLNREGKRLAESVLISEFAAGDNIARVFDNGNHIIVEDGKNRLFLFDQNMVYKANIFGEEGIVGFNDNEVLLKQGYSIIKRPYVQAASLMADTAFVFSDSTIPLRVNNAYILQKAKRGLILRSR